MALTPPTVAELGTFRGEAFATSGAEFDQATMVLQQATDALWVFTGLDEYPSDARVARIVKNAIMDLTLWLLSQVEHRDEINSPFSSERIGSYSYSKMQQASATGNSGIYWLDLLFRFLKNDEGDSVPWVSSERVFNPEGYTYEEQRAVDKFRLHDPTADQYWGFS
jgi:hypothetical protein